MRFTSQVAVLALTTILGACASHPSTTATSASSSTSPSGFVSAPTALAPTSTAGPSTVGPSTTQAVPANLVVTDAVRADLVKAGAALTGLPASEFTGLRPGATYYGFDPVTATYWAGAALVPSVGSLRAQVATQDDGSYMIFEEHVGGSWTAFNDGLRGSGPSACPAPVPAAILAVWHWPTGTCHPG